MLCSVMMFLFLLLSCFGGAELALGVEEPLTLSFSTAALPVSSEPELRAALSSPSPRTLLLTRALTLRAPLALPSHTELLGAAGASLELAAGVPGSALRIDDGATDVAVRDVRVALPLGEASWAGRPAALAVRGATRVALEGLVVEGGVSLAGGARVALSWSDVSNARGAQNGTCVYVPGCGDSRTLSACALTVHDNAIHDCRFDGVSIYDAAAQGVLLGAQDGAPAGQPNGGCTVGAVVRNNDVRGVDEMGIRVANDVECAAALNNVSYNRIAEWGQGSKANGGDGADR
jgi:hypothetical protein